MLNNDVVAVYFIITLSMQIIDDMGRAVATGDPKKRKRIVSFHKSACALASTQKADYSLELHCKMVLFCVSELSD